MTYSAASMPSAALQACCLYAVWLAPLTAYLLASQLQLLFALQFAVCTKAAHQAHPIVDAAGHHQLPRLQLDALSQEQADPVGGTQAHSFWLHPKPKRNQHSGTSDRVAHACCSC